MKKILLAFLIAAAPLFPFAQLPSYLPADGLIAWLPFSGNATDQSGHGNNGFVNGAIISTDRFNNANSSYVFDGSNDKIDFGSIDSINTFSLSFWFKRNNTQNVSYPIGLGINLLNTVDIYKGYGIGIAPASASCGLSGDEIVVNDGLYTCGNIIGNYQASNLEIWYHVVLVSNSNSASIFVNGILSDSSNSIFIPGIFDLVIGMRSDLFAPFNGKIDDVAIYNRALTPEEITALYTGVPTNNNGGGSTATTTVPAAISYQAVARNAQGQPLSDAAVQVKFTLLTDSLTGAAEYSESHSLTTNSLGLFTTAFGAGTPESGTFAAINWASGSKYLKVELDAGNGFMDMGTQQLLSAPYSMRSNTSAKAGTIENAGLPVYADNAAALAGGLIAGQMYRTATGDLKIVY